MDQIGPNCKSHFLKIGSHLYKLDFCDTRQNMLYQTCIFRHTQFVGKGIFRRFCTESTLLLLRSAFYTDFESINSSPIFCHFLGCQYHHIARFHVTQTCILIYFLVTRPEAPLASGSLFDYLLFVFQFRCGLSSSTSSSSLLLGGSVLQAALLQALIHVIWLA